MSQTVVSPTELCIKFLEDPAIESVDGVFMLVRYKDGTSKLKAANTTYRQALELMGNAVAKIAEEEYLRWSDD